VNYWQHVFPRRSSAVHRKETRGYPHSGNPLCTEQSGTVKGQEMRDDSPMSLAGIQSILDEFEAVGYVRRTVKRRDGHMGYEVVPEGERSFEARVYAACLQIFNGDPPVN
jgi:hypothetical protein